MVSRCSLCAYGLLAGSAASFILFVHTMVTLFQYSPTYTPVLCTHLENRLGDLTMGAAGVGITGYMEQRCENPNPYPIRFSGAAPGEVYAKTDSGLKLVGVSNAVPVELEADGEIVGTTEMHISMSPSDPEAMALLTQPLVHVVATVHVKVSAAISFLGVGFEESDFMVELCGVEVQMSTQKVGPIDCVPMEGGNITAAAEKLAIASVDDDELRTELMDMDQDRLDSATHKKNMAFGMMMALFSVLSIACFAGGIVARRRNRSLQTEVRELKIQPDEDDDQKVDLA